MRKIIVDKNDDNQKLIKYIHKYLDKVPRSLIQKWMRLKKIKLNGNKVNTQSVIYEGDIINLYIYDEEIDKWRSKKTIHKSRKIDVSIAYENNDIIIFDKGQNVLVHAANPEDYGNNVVDYMIDYLIEKKEYLPRLDKTFRPALVNRLDRNTMGLVIGGKNRNAILSLNSEKSLYKKYYLAIVEGRFDKSVVIENKLEKTDDNMVYVTNAGKSSKTAVTPLIVNDNYSLVEIELFTGRTHQIRASLASEGYPILGDRRYGNRDNIKIYKDQQLVAYKLAFSGDISLDSLKNLTVVSKYRDYIFRLYNEIIEK